MLKNIFKLISLFFYLVTGPACSLESKNMSTTTEYIVVFKKDISENTAATLMKDSHFNYSAGADSSKGKVYFYSTGPKFRVVVNNSDTEKFNLYFKSKSEIHEIYKANWNLTKD